MSWRIVEITRRAKLDLKMNYLVIRGEDISKIYLSEISTLIIENTAVSLTVALLTELCKRKIKVIFCDEKRNPLFENTAYCGSHDTSLKVKNQVEWMQSTKADTWTEIVREKILKQSQLLKRANCPQYALLEKYVDELEYNDTTNREGHAAKVYFNALFGKDFSRSSDNIKNAALNYGYSIILSSFNREIVACGYITQIGIFHDNRFNMYNLGCDMMEPYRTLVDEHIYNLNPTKFEHEEKMSIVNILNSEVHIDGKKHYVNNAIRIYCKSVLDSLDNRDISLIHFYNNEL